MPDIKDVEILATGEWGGRGWTEAYLNLVADNTNRLIDEHLHEPPAKLGHDDSQLFAQASGLPALGWFSNLRVKASEAVDGAKVLIADLIDVPTALYEAIKDKRYKKISAEVYHDFQHPTTAAFMGPALRAVALLGADVPEVKGLKDLLSEMKRKKKIKLAAKDTVRLSETDLTFHSEEPGGEPASGEGGTEPKEDKPASGEDSPAGDQKGTENPPSDKQGETTVDKEQHDKELAEKQAAIDAEKAKAAEAETKLAEAQSKLAELGRAERARRVDHFAEVHKEVMTPAVRPAFDALCEAIGESKGVIKLSEDKKEDLTGLDLVFRFAETLAKAKVAKMGEMAPGGENSDPAKLTVTMLAEKATSLVAEARKNGVTLHYDDAVRKAKAELGGE